MDDREFFDTLFQLWAKTTGAEDHYWMPVDLEDGVFDIHAVQQDGPSKGVASSLSDEDADFITAIHGCLPDLVRRLHAALDEADRADLSRDERECRIFELELENQALSEQISLYAQEDL